MNPLNANAQELADLIQRRFAAHPIPSYPPLMGLDPPGERDEYAAFANVAWPDVPPENFRWTGYDICPAIGFLECSRMWNYYFPGFMTASLLHEDRFDVIDGFVWRLREIAPPAVMGLGDPWWGGDTLFANFSHAQIRCVVRFLQFVREHGREAPYHYDWEPLDDRALRCWSALGE